MLIDSMAFFVQTRALSEFQILIMTSPRQPSEFGEKPFRPLLKERVIESTNLSDALCRGEVMLKYSLYTSEA
jgi:hypothetical protein